MTQRDATTWRPARVRLAWLAVSCAVLVIAVGASIAFGTRIVSLSEISAALSGDTSTVAGAAISARLPRTALAALAGAALAISGAALQAATRNPIADPGILGVSSGASLAIVISLVFFSLTSPYAYMAAALVGAAAAAVFVYAVGSLGAGGATPLKLALAGAATSAALGSLVSAILLPRVDLLPTFRFWQVGGVGGADWHSIAVIAPFLFAGIISSFALTKSMNLLSLGDEAATGLGQRVGLMRAAIAFAGVVLAAVTTSVTGPIGFVGLVVPHAVRLVVGSDYRWLVPLSATVGASLLIFADGVGRVIARPAEVEVGIVTAIVGAPFFIWIVRRSKVRGL